MMDDVLIRSLQEIGFNHLEGMIYLHLLSHPASSGYQLAKNLNKPKSNVYLALESLLSKAAVVTDLSTRNKLYTAIPIEQYLDQLQQRFSQQRIELETKLKDIRNAPFEYGFYPLDKMEQVFPKSIELINSARSKILVACMQLQEKAVIEALQKAVDRGVSVLIESYPPSPPVTDCDFSFYSKGTARLEDFFYNWLEILIDGDQYIFSLFSIDHKMLYKCIWCNEPYISLTTFNATVSSLLLTWVRERLSQNESPENILQELKGYMNRYYECIGKNKLNSLMNKYK
ncbi:MAG: hypothetical protein JW784_02335 [Candidatus Cloacimonetes bacterium]|nr:hypothetical protein [Candidatus Cloacimonadota bacterium]